MIISVQDDANHHQQLKAIKNAFPINSFYIELQPLAIDTALQIVDDWLYVKSRTLTSQQRQLISSAILRCSLPLFIKLIFNQAIQWHSYDSISQADLPFDTASAIHKLFDRLEMIHGKALFSRTAIYITSTRYGLTENEIQDLLSCDHQVMEEIHRYQPDQAIIAVPALLWLRLKHDLNDYVLEHEINGLTVMRWYHQQFIEVVRQRYLSNDQIQEEIHSQCANYYIG
ncbi:uncharacterized protein TRIADDRAFT_18313, partial [Trichoplax adhaerens]